jgi:phytanoyl-CoA hydroxylase
VTAWIALDDADPDNGCMEMVEGSHEWGDQLAFLRTTRDLPRSYDGHDIRVRSCPVRCGYVHYHHSLTWHRSGSNSSTRPRRAVAIHYISAATRYRAEGEHLLKAQVEAADGEPLRGTSFPLVLAAGVAVPIVLSPSSQQMTRATAMASHAPWEGSPDDRCASWRDPPRRRF